MQNELYDIYPTWHVPFWQATWFLILLGIVACILLCAAAWLYIRHVRAQKNKKTLWEQALYDLEQLRAQYPNGSQGKQFYGELTLIIKRYLQERYGYELVSKTDQEMIDYLTEKQFSPELVQQLQTVSDGALLIKFANMQVIEEQMKRDYETTTRVIHKTVPQPSSR